MSASAVRNGAQHARQAPDLRRRLLAAIGRNMNIQSAIRGVALRALEKCGTDTAEMRRIARDAGSEVRLALRLSGNETPEAIRQAYRGLDEALAVAAETTARELCSLSGGELPLQTLRQAAVMPVVRGVEELCSEVLRRSAAEGRYFAIEALHYLPAMQATGATGCVPAGPH